MKMMFKVVGVFQRFVLHLLNNTSVPGWPKIEKYISDTWGEGNYTIKVNPSNVCCHGYASILWIIGSHSTETNGLQYVL